MTVDKDGNPSKTVTSTDFIGYDSYSILGRVCLPTLTVLNNAFSSYSTQLSSSLSSSNLSNFVTDI